MRTPDTSLAMAKLLMLVMVTAVAVAGDQPPAAKASANDAADRAARSHDAMRPLPVPRPATRPIDPAAGFFVDPVRGNDKAAGTEQAPWRSLAFATRQLKPGNALFL